MTKKLLILILFMLIPLSGECGAPVRAKTYTTNTTIDAADVTANEDAIFSYLQSGVDTFAAGGVSSSELATDAVTTTKILDGTVSSADLAGSIAASKISGTAVTLSGAQTIIGAKTLSGTTTISGTQNITGTLQIGGVAVTSTATELNILDDVTADKDEINILDGASLDVAELNLLDGVTATTVELNYIDDVTSAIQTQLNAKMDDGEAAGGDLTGTYPNPTLAGTIVQAIQLSYTGNSADNRSITGAGFNPNYALIGSIDAGKAVQLKSFSLDGVDSSKNVGSNAMEPDNIQDFITDGIQIGADADVNENGSAFDVLLLLTATGAGSG